MTRARWSIVLATLLLAGASPAGAVSPAWSPATRVLLPAGATGLNQGYLPTLSCPDATDCAAAGTYLNAAGTAVGMVLDEVNGVWQRARAITAPANAASSPTLTPYSVSCASAGNCALVGSYLDASNNGQAFVADEVAGIWGPAEEVSLPSDAGAVGQSAVLHAVACTAIGACSAVGTYLDASTPVAHTEAMTLSETAGSWASAQTVALPSSTNADPNVALNLLACSSPGNCAATGSYLDANNVHRGLLVSEASGVWRSSDLATPPNASPYALAQVSSVACPDTGDCSAIGTYETADGRAAGFTVDERAGQWATAQMMRLPVSGAVNPHVFFYGYGGIACASAGNCATGGQYRDASGAYQGFVLSEIKGVWQPAQRVVLPRGASAGANGGVVAFACPSSGACRAGAAYLDAAGHYQGLLLSQRKGVWSASTVTLPDGASQVGVAGGIYALACTSARCTALGSYLAGPSTYQGFVVSGQ